MINQEEGLSKCYRNEKNNRTITVSMSMSISMPGVYAVIVVLSSPRWIIFLMLACYVLLFN
jgi:hypothetical protein